MTIGRRTKLNPELQKEIVKYLTQGVTDQATCDVVGINVASFYNWMDRGRKESERLKNATKNTEPLENEAAYLDFFEAVTRARGNAIAGAVLALRQGMMPNETIQDTEETFSETRIDKNGKPYTYTKKSNKRTVIKNPADWRAAVEYLKRRDRDNWSDRQEITGKDGQPVISLSDLVNAYKQSKNDDEGSR